MGPRVSTTGTGHVSDADAFALTLERDPLLRSTVVAVALLDRSPDWDRLEEVVERASRLSPGFRHKLVQPPLHLAPPRWIVDPDFDLSWHLQRASVRPGGDLPAVLAFARNTGMSAFDHDRPLWRITLLDGLPDGRAALVIKVHHSLTDGIGGIQLAAHVVDLQREPGPLGPRPPAPVATPYGPLEAVGDAALFVARQALHAGCRLTAAVPRAVVDGVRDPVRAITDAAATLASIARFVRPVTATDSPVMQRRRLQWRYDTFDVPFAELHDAAHRAGGTLNDAFLAALAGGLARYHEHHGTVVEQLRLTMPISIRAPGDAAGGNHVTLVRFEIPTDVDDPVRRMQLIAERCQALRHERAIPYSNAIAATLNLLPVAVTGGMLKHVDFLASNVPGFGADVFVAGARVEAFYPFGPTLGSAVNFTLMSHAGTCNIGVNTDAGAVPDPDVLVAAVRESFAEVLAVPVAVPDPAAASEP
jgi:diacylglycerol O-acyltransferase / wax synthase